MLRTATGIVSVSDDGIVLWNFYEQMNSEMIRIFYWFQSVDLTTNFYFSYTYDLSRTLQENMLTYQYRSTFVYSGLDLIETFSGFSRFHICRLP